MAEAKNDISTMYKDIGEIIKAAELGDAGLYMVIRKSPVKVLVGR